MDSRIYWIWLAQALGAGEQTMGDLLDTFGGAAVIYTTTDKALREARIPPRVVRKLRNKSLAEARAILNRVTLAGDWVLTPEDALYPVGLHRLADRPAALYCRGTMPDMDARLTLAVVGTREPSEEGWRTVYRRDLLRAVRSSSAAVRKVSMPPRTRVRLRAAGSRLQ